MKYRITVLPEAWEDVDHIHHWIAERSPDGAARWYVRLTEVLRFLETDPEACALAPENVFAEPEIRHHVFQTAGGKPYRILFTIQEQNVFVLHVRGPGQPFVHPDEF